MSRDITECKKKKLTSSHEQQAFATKATDGKQSANCANVKAARKSVALNAGKSENMLQFVEPY